MTDAGIEDFLTGKKLSQETLSAAAEKIVRFVLPIDDVRAAADYRRTVSGNLILRLSGMEKPAAELKRQSPSEGM
jgi:xanthine dehydrogenase iron-sulfur cluster and FAD-binding subunit A